MQHIHRPFGHDTFGEWSERFARFFGTPTFLIAQTFLMAAWISLSATGITHFDLFPFMFLNLGFSIQAAYAAPLILLAQTRQADRDKIYSESDRQHREELACANTALSNQVLELTKEVHKLAAEIHAKVISN